MHHMRIILIIKVFGYLIVFAFTAYLTRGLQYLFGTSKRGMTERGDELGGPHEDIPLATIHELSGPPTPGESNVPTPSESIPPTPGESVTTSMVPLLDSNDLANELQEPLRAQDPASITGTGGPPTHEHVPGSTSWMYRQEGLPLNRAQEWATIVNARIDVYTYMIILFLIGLPIYLAMNYAMPAQLSLNVLAYFLALELPPNWRRFLHPALVASVVTICGIYILAMCRGDDFHDGLLAYQTKTKYQQLFSGKTNLPKPGAGDFLSSILDVSIVALALPMYQYRQELKRSVRDFRTQLSLRANVCPVFPHHHSDNLNSYSISFWLPVSLPRDRHLTRPKSIVPESQPHSGFSYTCDTKSRGRSQSRCCIVYLEWHHGCSHWAAVVGLAPDPAR